MIILLGNTNEYINIFDLDFNSQYYKTSEIDKIKNKLLEKNIRNRTFNIKKYL